MVDYPSVTSSANLEIEILPSCKAPLSITPVLQKNPLPYKYSTWPATFKIRKFVTEPEGCEVTYACNGVDGPDSDVGCNVEGVAQFDGVYDGDESDGTYSF